MRNLTLIALLSIATACTKPAPQSPVLAPDNAACTFAHTKLKDAPCVPLITTTKAKPGMDTAIADFGGVVAYCAAGGGDPVCVVWHDFRSAPEAPQSKPAPVPAPTPPATAQPENKGK